MRNAAEALKEVIDRMHSSPVPKSVDAFERQVAVSVLDKSCIAKANEVCCRDDAIQLIAQHASYPDDHTPNQG